jgi:hypothetical protein
MEEKKIDKIDLKKIFVEKYIKSLKFPHTMEAEKAKAMRKNHAGCTFSTSAQILTGLMASKHSRHTTAQPKRRRRISRMGVLEPFMIHNFKSEEKVT